MVFIDACILPKKPQFENHQHILYKPQYYRMSIEWLHTIWKMSIENICFPVRLMPNDVKLYREETKNNVKLYRELY